MKIVLATSNKGKVREMSETLAEFGFEVIPQSQLNVDDAVEDGLTFIENAIIKARHASAVSGLPAIADDSGIEVDALGGEPGIYSARYSGEGDAANNEKLLSKLKGNSNRKARFVCAMVYLRHQYDPVPLICLGYWQGEIAQQACGDNGFGYDPIFYVPELNKHSAELDAQTKNKLSHRGKALQILKQQLQQL